MSEAVPATPQLAELLAARDGAFAERRLRQVPLNTGFVALQGLAKAHIGLTQAVAGGLLRELPDAPPGQAPAPRGVGWHEGTAAQGGPVHELHRALEDALGGEEGRPAEAAEAPQDWRDELDRARSEAFAAGMAEGRRQAEAAYGTAIADLGAVMARAEAATRIDTGRLASDLLDMVTTLTRAVVEAQPVLAPELLLPRIERAVEALRAMNEPSELRINPFDALLVRDHYKGRLRRSRLKLVEDGAVPRGGFRLATAEAALEDTFEARLARLGQELSDCAAEVAHAAA